MGNWGSVLMGPSGHCRLYLRIIPPENREVLSWTSIPIDRGLSLVVSVLQHTWVLPTARPGKLPWRWREHQCGEAERFRLLSCEAGSVLRTVYSCSRTQVGRGNFGKGMNSVCHTSSWLKLVHVAAHLSSSHRGSHAHVGPAQPYVQGIATRSTFLDNVQHQ